ncbi:DNA primase [Salegentibacter salegens]|uniref:DNA primase n=1 Tax=Salegentibacter salegens TaxID=143223 RepID=A0A1M7I0L1_9FLAO|nr:DNA primase [Salegentibacter salegens]PRX45286.1 DNA primase [Salegentibacter salegens]SHM34255.1 DNA primase [Salegentibacter salegens]
MISKTTIDNVFETARVEEVIGDFVNLKKSGSNFKGLSPFSDERTPSFMVSPVKQIWKDFSSGKGGNVVAFLMEHEHFTYPEAIKYLAKKYGIEIEETQQSDEQKQQADERESMYLVSEFANKHFQKNLHKTDFGKAIGLSYFKERGFTLETIKKFELGYSLDEWDDFTKEALAEAYKLEYLEKTGLTIVKGEKQFDRFKGRVMFPIHSMSGRVLGFGGRILTNEKKAAKYLNSPESDIYHKSKVLYGINFAKQAIAKEDNCFLVEGYTDVIQFHQSGVENVVSSSGTALTPDQIRLINRLTKNITVLFDGDAAGIRASLRGIDLILEQGMNVRVCTFPAGEDPDSFAKNNSDEALAEYLQENTQDFISFKASLLMEDAKKDPVKKAELIRDIVNSISKIPDTIQQEVYLQECSRIMDISENVLFSSLAQLNAKSGRTSPQQQQQKKSFDVVKEESQPKTAKVDEQYELEKKIISLLLQYGTVEEEFEDLVLKEKEDGELGLEKEIQKTRVFEKIFLDLQEDEIAFTNPKFRDIYAELISRLNSEEKFEVKNFINDIDPEQASEITSILMEEEQYKLHEWDRQNIFVKAKTETISRHVSETILSLRRFLINEKINELSEKVKTPDEEQNTQHVLEDVKDYLSLKKVLSEKLNRVM